MNYLEEEAQFQEAPISEWCSHLLKNRLILDSLITQEEGRGWDIPSLSAFRVLIGRRTKEWQRSFGSKASNKNGQSHGEKYWTITSWCLKNWLWNWNSSKIADNKDLWIIAKLSNQQTVTPSRFFKQRLVRAFEISAMGYRLDPARERLTGQSWPFRRTAKWAQQLAGWIDDSQMSRRSKD